MKAIVLITVAKGEIQNVIKDIRRSNDVQEVYSAFGPYDVITILEGGDLAALGSVVAREIQPIPGVIKTITCLVADPDAVAAG